MKKWTLRFLGFLVLFVVMNFIVAGFIRFVAPGFMYTLADWFHSPGVEVTLDLLVDFTWIASFVSALAITILIVIYRKSK